MSLAYEDWKDTDEYLTRFNDVLRLSVEEEPLTPYTRRPITLQEALGDAASEGAEDALFFGFQAGFAAAEFSDTDYNRMAQKFYEVASASGAVKFPLMTGKAAVVDALRAAVEYVRSDR
jgi:hypothetical protein